MFLMTDIITNISKARQLISGSRLLSCYKTVEPYENEFGKRSEKSVWRTNDPQVNVNIEKNISCDYCLIIIDGIVDADDNGEENGQVSLKYHFASETNADDWVCIINNFLFRQKELRDKYSYHELLWFLANNNVDENIFSEALLRYDSDELPLIVNELSHIARCLSLKKQRQLKNILYKYGKTYQIYCPDMISQALSSLENQIQITYEDHDLFAVIDTVLFDGMDKKTIHYRVQEHDSDNELLHLLYWLTHPESTFGDYDILCKLFSYMPSKVQMDIVKRYFHDLRQGYFEVNIEILSQFRGNRYAYLSRYRHCISSLVGDVDLTVTLLSDSLLTIFNTKGDSFQTFNGFLDLSICNADVAYPSLTLNLKEIFPICDGGAVYNRDFKGFIDYHIFYRIDQEKLENHQLLDELMIKLLDCFAQRTYHLACNSYGEEYKISSNCKKLRCENLVDVFDGWHISLGDTGIDVLNLFLKEQITNKENDRLITVDQISWQLLQQNFTRLLRMVAESENDGLYIMSDSFWGDYLKVFLIPEKIRIVPRQEVLLFKPYRDIPNPYKYLFFNNIGIRDRIENSLKDTFGIDVFNGKYFEINYEEKALKNLLEEYYYQGKLYQPQDDNDLNRWIYKRQTIFLISAYSGKYSMVCAPEKSEVCDNATKLPYFWCSGKKCFANALDKQTLQEESDWHNYTIFHLLEIIGYTKIHKIDAGYEPDNTVRSFIAILNRARQKFEHLKCSECGHLMFPSKTKGYNVYNRYSCINPQCSEFHKEVYLNFCYKCKTGFIDSRDTKQCPNGWYICPDCLGCCDDEQYEWMQQRYLSDNKPVPSYIRQKIGFGHNNKGIYFCPKCGNRLNSMKKDKKILYCEICNH